MSDELPDDLQQCRRCPLWARATQAVGGEGDSRARLMLVGEQPGQEEDLAGRPFVGPAGRLLDRALEIARVRPIVIVALGATAGRALLGGPVTIANLRGRPIPHEDLQILVTYHPSAVLRVPERSRQQVLYRSLVEDLMLASRIAEGRDEP
jgi:uracil-DNA glycosylase